MAHAPAVALAAGCVLVLITSCCAITGTGSRSCMPALCSLLSFVSLLAVVVAIVEAPVPQLAASTTHAALEWQWQHADSGARASMEDQLQCCGFYSPTDR